MTLWSPVRDGNPAAITVRCVFSPFGYSRMMVLTPVIAGTTTAGSELKKLWFFHDVTVVCEYPSNRYQAKKLRRSLHFHFFKSNDRRLAFKYCEILSNVIIIDLQKIHFAPKGFMSETSKDDVLYWEPWQHGHLKWIWFVILSTSKRHYMNSGRTFRSVLNTKFNFLILS